MSAFNHQKLVLSPLYLRRSLGYYSTRASTQLQWRPPPFDLLRATFARHALLAPHDNALMASIPRALPPFCIPLPSLSHTPRSCSPIW